MPRWKEGTDLWERIGGPTLSALDEFLRVCSKDLRTNDSCPQFAAAVVSRSDAARRQLADLSLDPEHAGWRTAVTSSFEDLAEGMSVLAKGPTGLLGNQLERVAALLKRGQGTLSALGSPQNEIPDDADQAAREFWTRENYVSFENGTQCPAHYWSLTGAVRPSSDEFEKRDYDTKAPELRREMRNRTYMVEMTTPQLFNPDAGIGSTMELGKYDFKKGEFTVVVESRISCKDGNWVDTRLVGSRDEMAFTFHLPEDTAQKVKAWWSPADYSSLKILQLAFRPDSGKAVPDAVRGTIVAARMYVNGFPVFAHAGPKARPVSRR